MCFTVSSDGGLGKSGVIFLLWLFQILSCLPLFGKAVLELGEALHVLDAAGALSCVLTSVCFRCCTTRTERCEGSCKGCASSCRRAGLREGCQQQVTCRRAQCPSSQQEQHSLWIQVSVGVWGGLLCLNCCRRFWYWAAVGGKKEKMGGGEEGDGERRLS